MNKLPRILLFFLIILLINTSFFLIDPQEIVFFLGIGNSLFALFLISILAGVSSFGGTVWFSSLLAFSGSGISPFLLGIVSGIGIFLSDTLFYHLALYGKRSLPEKWQQKIKKVLNFIERTPDWIIFILAFLYLGVTLLPADLLMLLLVLAGYSYKRIFPILLFGSISISFIVAFLGKTLLF